MKLRSSINLALRLALGFALLPCACPKQGGSAADSAHVDVTELVDVVTVDDHGRDEGGCADPS